MNRLNRRIIEFRLNDDETIRIRPLNALLRLKAAEIRAKAEALENPSEQFKLFTLEFICPACAFSIVDEAGERVYSEENAHLIAEEFTGDELDQIQAKVLEISRINLEATIKNFEPSPQGSQPSE